MKALFLAIIALFQISCVSTVRSTTDGEMYYKVTIPFTLDATPAGIVREAGNFYSHTQETETTYSDTKMTKEQVHAGVKAFVIENAPSGGVRDAIYAYEAVRLVKVASAGPEIADEKSTEEKLAELNNDKSFSGLIQKLKIIWSNPK